MVKQSGFQKFFLFFVFLLNLFRFSSLTSFADNDEYWKDAASFIQSGDFQNALKTIDQLLSERPNDILLLRLKAICLFELKDEDKAVKTLRQAIAIDPTNISCRYYLAQTLAYTGNILEAKKFLTEVITEAPNSEYAKMAHEVFPKLENLSISAEVLPQEHRWNFSTRTAGEYDDNVPSRSKHEPGNDPKDSFQFIASCFLEFHVLDEKMDASPLTTGLSYTGYQSLHERKIFNDFDVTSHTPSLFVEKSSYFKSMPFKTRLSTNYTKTELGFSDYSDSVELKTNFELQWAAWAVFSPHYSIELRSFKDDSVSPKFYSRDGIGECAGFDQQFYLFNNKIFISIGYDFQWDNTEGVFFEINSHNASGSISLSLPWKFRLYGQLEFHTEDYSKFTVSPQRFDNVYTLSTGLSRPLWKDNLSAEFTYSYSTSDSNYNFSEYERSVYGIALNCNF